MKQITINTYSFNELSKEAKNRAISDHIEFWLEAKLYNEENPGNFEKAINEAERMQTPWFTSSYVLDYCKDEIIEEININDYAFKSDGKLI